MADFHSQSFYIDVLAEDGEWTFQYAGKEYSMTIDTERELIKKLLVDFTYNQCVSIVNRWEPNLDKDPFLRFFLFKHLPEPDISQYKLIATDSTPWQFDYKSELYLMNYKTEMNLIKLVSLYYNSNFEYGKGAIKSFLIKSISIWDPKLANSHFIGFFHNTHLLSNKNKQADQLQLNNKKKSINNKLWIGLGAAIITSLAFILIKNCSDRPKIDSSEHLNESFSSSNQPDVLGLQYGDTIVTNKGNVVRFFGFDNSNYIFETDVLLSQSEITTLIEKYNLDPGNRYQLTFKHGEIMATYGYVENGVLKLDEDSPKSKDYLEQYIIDSDTEDVKEFIDQVYETVQKDWVKETAIGCFKDAADKLEDYRIKYGNTESYKQLKQHFYNCQKSRLGRIYAKAIDDGGKTVAQEMEELQAVENEKERKEQEKIRKEKRDIVSSDGNKYYMPSKQPACYTEKDLLELAALIVAQDQEGVANMIMAGKVVKVGPGPCRMIEKKKAWCQIRIDGQLVWVNGEDVRTR